MAEEASAPEDEGLAARAIEALVAPELAREPVCADDRAALIRRLEASAGDAPGLPPVVHAALTRAEPFVLVGLERSDWPTRWHQFLGLLNEWYSPMYGSRPAEHEHLRVAFAWNRLLERDRDRARSLTALDALRQCPAERGPCERCVSDAFLGRTDSRAEWNSPPPSRSELSAQEMGHFDREAFIHAWSLPYQEAIRALDAIASGARSMVRRQQALLLAAIAAIGRRDLDVARAQLERARAFAPRAAPHPATDFLLGVVHLLDNRTTAARHALTRASTVRTVGAPAREAAAQLLAALPAEQR